MTAVGSAKKLVCLTLQRHTFAALTSDAAVDSIQAVCRERAKSNESKLVYNMKLIQQVLIAGKPLLSLLTKPLLMLVNALEEIIFLQDLPIIRQGEHVRRPLCMAPPAETHTRTHTQLHDTYMHMQGDMLYIIKDGRAVVSTDQKAEVDTLSDGDIFGEMVSQLLSQ